MKVLYNGEEIELNETNNSNIRKFDLFNDETINEDTIELQPEDLQNNNDISKIELEKTIELEERIDG